MEAKSLVPKLRFKDEEGNDFPDWKNSTIGEECEINGGGTPDSTNKNYWGDEIYWFTPTEIKVKYLKKSKRMITREGLNKSSAKLLPKGSLLLTTRATIGDVSFCTNECSTNQGFQSFLPTSKPNLDFLYYWIKCNKKELIKRSSGSTFLEISKKEIKKITINLPNINEQQKIASFLSSIDKKINLLTKKKALLETYKKGVMQKIFSQEIRFKDEEGKDFPDWEFKRGNELFDSISNKSHNSDLPILAISQEFGAIPRELINYKVSVTNSSVSSYKVVEKGDFIISLRSFQGGIEYSIYKGICSPAYIILRPTKEINDYYFKLYFKTHSYIQELTKKLEGIRDGKMISYKYFSEINLPYPCIREQNKIASFLSSIDKKIEQVNFQLDRNKEFKKGLLQQMFV